MERRRGNEGRRIEPADFAVRPACELSIGQADGIGVGRRVVTGQRKSETVAVGRKLETGDHPRWMVHACGVVAFQKIQDARTVLINREGDVSRLMVDGDPVDIPGNVFGEPRVVLGCQVEPCQLTELAPQIRRQVNRPRIGTEAEQFERDRGVARNRQRLFFACRDVENCWIRFVDRDITEDQELGCVARPVFRLPKLRHRFSDASLSEPRTRGLIT